MDVPMLFKPDTHVNIVSGEHAGLSGTLCVYFSNGQWIFRPDGIELGGVGHLWVKQADVEEQRTPVRGSVYAYVSDTPDGKLFEIHFLEEHFDIELHLADGRLSFVNCNYYNDETRAYADHSRVKDMPTEAMEFYNAVMQAQDLPERVNRAIDRAVDETIREYEGIIEDWRQAAARIKMEPKISERMQNARPDTKDG